MSMAGPLRDAVVTSYSPEPQVSSSRKTGYIRKKKKKKEKNAEEVWLRFILVSFMKHKIVLHENAINTTSLYRAPDKLGV